MIVSGVWTRAQMKTETVLLAGPEGNEFDLEIGVGELGAD
jgi:hypothetical protein